MSSSLPKIYAHHRGPEVEAVCLVNVNFAEMILWLRDSKVPLEMLLKDIDEQVKLNNITKQDGEKIKDFIRTLYGDNRSSGDIIKNIYKWCTDHANKKEV